MHAPAILCLPCHGGRLSTLLETAAELRFFRMCGRNCAPQGRQPLGGMATERNVALLVVAGGTSLLVCGGLTSGCQEFLEAQGVRVVAWVCGGIDCIVRAQAAGTLHRHRLAGCGHGGRRGVTRPTG